MPRLLILNQVYYNSPFPRFCIKKCTILRDFPAIPIGRSISERIWEKFSDEVDRALEQITEGNLFARRWLFLSCCIFSIYLTLTVATAIFEENFSAPPPYVSYSLIGIAILLQIVVYMHNRGCCERVFSVDVLKICQKFTSLANNEIRFTVESEFRRSLKSLFHKPSTNKHYFIAIDIESNDEGADLVFADSLRGKIYEDDTSACRDQPTVRNGCQSHEVIRNPGNSAEQSYTKT